VPLSIAAERQVNWRRLLLAGLTAAALTGLGGGLLELRRLGFADDAAARRVEAEVRREFDAVTGRLAAVASAVAGDPRAAAALDAGPDAARTLFDLVRDAAGGPDGEVAATVYDTPGTVARAWVGRPSDIPADRVAGTSAFFVIQTPLGLRLVHVQPIAGADGRRVGAVAAEYALSPAVPAAAMVSPEYTLPTRVAPVSLRTRVEGAGDRPRPGAFILRSPAGDPLLEAEIADADLARARVRWHQRVAAAVVIVCGVTLLLLIGPLLDRRGRARTARDFVRPTAGASGLLLGGAATVWAGLALLAGGWPAAPVSLTIGCATAAALATLLAGGVARLPLQFAGRRAAPASRPVAFASMQLAAGAIVAILLIAFGLLLGTAFAPVAVRLRNFSLPPIGDAGTLSWLAGVLALHLAAVWSSTLVFAAAPSAWRLPRRPGRAHLVLFTLWLLPVVVGGAVAGLRGWPLSVPGLLGSAIACATAALIAHRVVTWYRHATVAARIRRSSSPSSFRRCSSIRWSIISPRGRWSGWWPRALRRRRRTTPRWCRIV
jgi:MFS family permease